MTGRPAAPSQETLWDHEQAIGWIANCRQVVSALLALPDRPVAELRLPVPPAVRAGIGA